jgi:hypothetical protein
VSEADAGPPKMPLQSWTAERDGIRDRIKSLEDTRAVLRWVLGVLIGALLPLLWQAAWGWLNK